MASAPLQGTESAAKSIERVRYTHDAMIDLLIGNPSISQNTLAAHFGFTVPWVSRIVNSDAFQARLAERKADLVDPALSLGFEEKLKALATVSLDILHEKLTLTRSSDLALKAGELSVKALGYGARQANVNVQTNFVVALPVKSQSEADWAAAHAGGPNRGGVQRVEAQNAEVVDVLAKSPDLAALASGAAAA